jgi:uncharacterized repeat protein (TIGR02543 family)
MNGGTVSGNKTTGASRDGGGVYVGAGTSFILNGGTVSGNTAMRNGGGAYITGANASFTMNGGSVAGNKAGNFGGGMYVTGASASLTMKSGTVSDNEAKNYGGGVFSPNYTNLAIPADGSVAFSGNTASRLYQLTNAHKTAPPVSFAGAVSEISAANLNEVNGFDVSTPANVAAANKKSVFNNYDINYTSTDILDACAVEYLDENEQPIKSLRTSIALERGKKTKYRLEPKPSGETGNFNWILADMGNLAVFRDGETAAAGKGAVLAPQSGLELNVLQPGEPAATTSASLTLSALPEYTISYNLDGGTGAADNPVSYTKKSAFPIGFGAPTKADYRFEGWTVKYTSGTGTDVTTPTQSYSIPAGTTGNVTLTAQWSENARFSVTYDGNGNTAGAVPVDANAYYADSSVTALGHGLLAKAGYTFTGWNTQADGSGTSYAAAATFKITENVTLYAQWKHTETPPTPPPAEDGKTGKPDPGAGGNGAGSHRSSGSPATGDASPLATCAVIAAGSLLIVLILLLWRGRKRKDAE